MKKVKVNKIKCEKKIGKKKCQQKEKWKKKEREEKKVHLFLPPSGLAERSKNWYLVPMLVNRWLPCNETMYELFDATIQLNKSYALGWLEAQTLASIPLQIIWT